MYISSACTVHPPANISWLTVFMAEFPDFLKYCNLCCSKLLMLRDFNIHFDSPSNPNTARVLVILNTFNTEQAVSEQTHQQGHILDWVPYRKEEHMLCFCFVKHGISSDHLPVLCHLDVTRPAQQHIFQTVRNIRTIDRLVLKADVATLITAFNFPTANQLNDQLHTYLDRHAPATQRKVSWRWPNLLVQCCHFTATHLEARQTACWEAVAMLQTDYPQTDFQCCEAQDHLPCFYSSKIILSTTCGKKKKSSKK